MTTVNNKKTILLLFGGQSPEHDVSIESAKNIYKAIDESKYDIILGFIDKNGEWWAVESIGQKSDIRLTPVMGKSGVAWGDTVSYIDCIFPVLHGENGEDGTIQGLARLINVPIVGCGVSASAICIDKAMTKRILEQAGIPVVPYVVALRDDPAPKYDFLQQKLGSVLFVKPAHLGSSIGVAKISSQQQLADAMQAAFSYDDCVLIEMAVEARELELGVLGGMLAPKVSVVGEIIPDSEFYSYESKYGTASTTQVNIPADVTENVATQLQEYAKQAFSLLGCTGLARVDFFLAKNDEIYVNEVNTMPGFTNISMYPKVWEASGVSYTQLVSDLIGIEFQQQKIKINYYFHG